MQDYIENEERLIGLLLSDKEIVKKWDQLNFNDSKKYNEIHKNILDGIKHAYNNDVQLTRQSFKEFLSSYKKLAPIEMAAEIAIYDRCVIKSNSVNINDLPTLLEKVKEFYIRRKTVQSFNDYKKDKDKLGDLSANRILIDKLSNLEADSVQGKTTFLELHQAKETFLENLQKRRSNPDDRLTCGIPEIDDTMTVGFKPGHLTLFSADVSSFKTTIMVNVALNIFIRSNQEANVLFIPLEMSPDEILQKIVSRETQISMGLIEHAHKLTDQQIEIISAEMDKWVNLSNRFAILEVANRTVSSIRREIDKRFSYFKPKIVVIDYVDNLEPELVGARPDLQMNKTLEDLRIMGKQYGCSIISACQFHRHSLTRQKESKDKNASIGSMDLRGGQVMAANSDTVYAQWRNPSNPSEELVFSCIKARHGSTLFSNKRDKTILKVIPEIGLIKSPTVIDWNSNKESDYQLSSAIGQVPPMSVMTDIPDDKPF